MTFTLLAAIVLYVVAGFSNGEYMGGRVFDSKESCESFVEDARAYYKEAEAPVQVTDCIPVAIPGSGA